jgi:hypothetical protein
VGNDLGEDHVSMNSTRDNIAKGRWLGVENTSSSFGSIWTSLVIYI